MEQGWDPRGEAAAALTRVVEGFGPQVLGRADMLTGLLEDDVPHLPREVALLTAAARSGTSGLLTERLGQGLSAEQAVSMAAAEMTARTAMDASGARWAVGEFSRVLGHPLQAPTPVTHQPTVLADGGLTMTAPPAAPHLRPPAAAPATPGVALPVTAPPGAPPATPGVAQPVTAPPAPPGVPPAKGPAATAAITLGVAAVLAFFWNGGDNVVFWADRIVLLTGAVTAAVWVIRRPHGAAGFAAVLGFAAPFVAWAFSDTVGAFQTSYARLELTMPLWLIATLIATVVAVTSLVRGRHLGRRASSPLAAATAAAGLGYTLANILVQGNFYFGGPIGNVLGPGVSGWWIVSGILFLGLVALPPLLGLLMPGSGALVALWIGWLVFALANQISNSPVHGISAAPGLYLTWILWVAALLGTVALAARARSAGPAALATPASP